MTLLNIHRRHLHFRGILVYIHVTSKWLLQSNRICLVHYQMLCLYVCILSTPRSQNLRYTWLCSIFDYLFETSIHSSYWRIVKCLYNRLYWHSSILTTFVSFTFTFVEITKITQNLTFNVYCFIVKLCFTKWNCMSCWILQDGLVNFWCLENLPELKISLLKIIGVHINLVFVCYRYFTSAT